MTMKGLIKFFIEERVFNVLNKEQGDSLGNPEIKGNFFSLSSLKGVVRKGNQDKLIICHVKNPFLSEFPFYIIALADGMGGMQEGAKAASLALSTFVSELATTDVNFLKQAAVTASNYANKKVYEKFGGKGGTTLSSLIVNKNGYVAVNIGDSRIFKVDKKKNLKQITKDDTIGGQLDTTFEEEVDQWFDPSRADNRLVQFVGIGDSLEIHSFDFKKADKSEDDTLGFLITSDGAHYIGRIMMEKILKSSEELNLGVDRIVQVSEWLSGHDNSSAIFSPWNLEFESSENNKYSLSTDVFTVNDQLSMVFDTKLITEFNKIISEYKAEASKSIDLKYNEIYKEKLEEKLKEIKEAGSKKTPARKNKKSKQKNNSKENISKKKNGSKGEDCETENLELEFIEEDGGNNEDPL